MVNFRSRLAGVIGAVGAAAAACALAAAPSAHAAGKDLKIYYIDVEGGAATLYVTPEGHTLLIDTGWPEGMGGPKVGPNDPPPAPTPSSAQRIAATLKKLGLKKIDRLLISHYHIDHIGGFIELIKLVPVGEFLDHGENREMPRPGATPAQIANSTDAHYHQYMDAIAGKSHRIVHAGDEIKIDDLVATAVNADGQVIDHSLAPSAGPGVDCDKPAPNKNNGGEENVRSVGLVFKWGKARVMALADTTGDVETKLVCPVNLIGKIDLMLIDNHGTDNSNGPNLLESVKPTVVVFDNGPVKGADGSVLHEVRTLPDTKGMWQLHFATRSPGENTAPDEIVNPMGQDPILPLEADVGANGTITMINPRTGYKQAYKQ